jgi:hypothetical protein
MTSRVTAPWELDGTMACVCFERLGRRLTVTRRDARRMYDYALH